jgi:hypothetical protein
MGQDYGTLDQCLEQEARLRDENERYYSPSDDGEVASSNSSTSYHASPSPIVKPTPLLLLPFIGLWMLIKGIGFVILVILTIIVVGLLLAILGWVFGEVSLFVTNYFSTILLVGCGLLLALGLYLSLKPSKTDSKTT